MKRCFRCRETKPLAEFYVHKEMADGHLGKCKICTRLDVKLNRARNSDHYRAYDRSRPREKVYARRRVTGLVYRGKLKRGSCERCGQPNAQAHHDDYRQALKVRWLCSKCHGEEHRSKEPHYKQRTLQIQNAKRSLA